MKKKYIMACSKYTLTNTGSTIVNFNYRRCDDSMWQYQVELTQNQTKNIWLIDSTYSIAPVFESSIVLVNNGVFPPVVPTPTPTSTPTNTPTNTGTPTNTPTPTVTTTETPTNTPTTTETPTNTPTTTETPTPTPTPTVTTTETPTNTPTTTETPTNTPTTTETPTPTPTETPTNTPTTTETPTPTPTPTVTTTETPTNTPTTTETPTQTNTPTQARFTFAITSGATSNVACDSGDAGTIYGDESIFNDNTQFYNSLTGPVTIDMTGYYANSGVVVELTSGGAETGGYTLCSILPTLTQTPTVTQTPTNTSTSTPTPTTTPTNTETPTTTPTNTETPTTTPTETPTNTPTQTTTNTPTPTTTPTVGYYVYSFGYDVTSSVTACSATPSNYYLSPSLNPLDLGDYIYTDTSLTTPASNGYYSNSIGWYLVTGGSGQITSNDPNGC